MTSEHLLDLSDFKRDTVKLPDGTTVALRNPNEFGPIDEFHLRGLIEAVNSYDPEKITTEDDALKVSEDLHSLAAMIAIDDLPEDLDDGSCAAIFGAWFAKHATANPPTPPRTPQDRKKKSTGAKSSPGSKRSTAATPKRGSTSRSAT